MRGNQLDQITDDTIDELLDAERAVLVLVRSDRSYCATYLAEVAARRAQGGLAGVAVGTLALDQPEVARFIRTHPWADRLDFVPYHLVYRRGQRVDGFATSRLSYLLTRLDHAFAGHAPPSLPSGGHEEPAPAAGEIPCSPAPPRPV